MNDVQTFIAQAEKKYNALIILENMENFAHAHLQQILHSYPCQGVLVKVSKSGKAYCEARVTHGGVTIASLIPKSNPFSSELLVAHPVLNPQLKALTPGTCLTLVSCTPGVLRVFTSAEDLTLCNSLLIPPTCIEDITPIGVTLSRSTESKQAYIFENT